MFPFSQSCSIPWQGRRGYRPLLGTHRPASIPPATGPCIVHRLDGVKHAIRAAPLRDQDDTRSKIEADLNVARRIVEIDPVERARHFLKSGFYLLAKAIFDPFAAPFKFEPPPVVEYLADVGPPVSVALGAAPVLGRCRCAADKKYCSSQPGQKFVSPHHIFPSSA